MFSQPEIAAGTLDAYKDFQDLVRSLGDDELATPSRCDGWSVGDVAAHVIGSLTDIVNGRLEGLGTPEVTAREVDERRGHSAAELADELGGSLKVAVDLLSAFDENAWNGPAPAGNSATLGRAVEALWYDTYLHGEDIRAAIGREPARGIGLDVSVSHLADMLTIQNWGNATLKLDGAAEEKVGDGSGPTITGDALDFVLVATGRADPASFGLDETVNVYRDQ